MYINYVPFITTLQCGLPDFYIFIDYTRHLRGFHYGVLKKFDHHVLLLPANVQQASLLISTKEVII